MGCGDVDWCVAWDPVDGVIVSWIVIWVVVTWVVAIPWVAVWVPVDSDVSFLAVVAAPGVWASVGRVVVTWSFVSVFAVVGAAVVVPVGRVVVTWAMLAPACWVVDVDE